MEISLHFSLQRAEGAAEMNALSLWHNMNIHGMTTNDQNIQKEKKEEI